jgi:hypothetical protein
MSTTSYAEPDPIPITRRILEAAREMKAAGLPWMPRVGCFVWDPDQVIKSPSPFAMQVYFVLNMQRFLTIFGSVATMQEKLVWLPTWYQARQLCDRYGLTPDQAQPRNSERGITPGEAQLLRIYGLIGGHLESIRPDASPADGSVSGTDFTSWIDAVLHDELVDVGDLPPDVWQRIRSGYLAVGKAYLGWLRIKHRQPENWYPPESAFDETVLDALGHFYSDYQKDIRILKTIRQILAQLRSIDRTTAPEAHQLLVDRLRKPEAQAPSSSQILADLVETS